MNAHVQTREWSGWTLIHVECPAIDEDGGCGCDVEVRLDTVTGPAIVGTCPLGCEHTPEVKEAMIAAARKALDNYDGPADGDAWSGGFAENH